MWLKRLVAVTLIVSSLAMAEIIIYGVSRSDSNTGSILNSDGSITQVDQKNPDGTPVDGISSSSSSSSESTSSSSSDGSSSSGTNTAGGQTGQSGSSGSTGGSASSSGAGGTTSGSGSGGSSGGGSTGGGSTGGGTGGGGTTVTKPVVTISVSPKSITAGSSSTIGWSATNSPTSCTAGGSWSGTKAASGSQSTGTMNSAGTFTYSLTCANAGGSSTASVSLSVAAAPVVYCGGAANCYGNADMAAHASSSTCWAYTKYNRSGNYASVFNLNAASPGSKISSTHGLKGISSGNFYSKCGQDMTVCLNGSGQCGSWKNHSSGNMSSYSQTFIGYYDPAKP